MHFFQLVFKENYIIKLKSQFCGDGCSNLLWVGSTLLGTGIKILSIHSWNWCYPMHTWNLLGLGFVVQWSIIRNLGDSFDVVEVELWMGFSVERYCISILVTALKLQ
jgi:hypothetical protein